MNVIFMLPNGSPDVERFKRTAALLRDAAHRTVFLNPTKHRPEETYHSQSYVIAGLGFRWAHRDVYRDYINTGAKVIEIATESPEDIVKKITGEEPQEVRVAEGLPTARPITNTPSGTLEGLPPIVGDDAGDGEGLIIRSEGRRSK